MLKPRLQWLFPALHRGEEVQNTESESSAKLSDYYIITRSGRPFQQNCISKLVAPLCSNIVHPLDPISELECNRTVESHPMLKFSEVQSLMALPENSHQ